MREHKIAAIPGDGIGSEVINEGIRVLSVLADRSGDFKIEVTNFPWGSEYYLETGNMMASNGLDELRKFDAIYFGSAGDPRIPDHLSLWGLRLAICQSFDQYANVRPTRLLPGISSPLKDVSSNDIEAILKLAKELAIDLVVVGPEAPLVAGLSDLLRENGIPSFGPHSKGAELEGSKLHAKRIMEELFRLHLLPNEQNEEME